MRLSRALLCLATYGMSAAAAQATGSSSATLTLADTHTAAGVNCPQAQGVYVALLVPGKGLALLATKQFPGSQQVGTVDRNRLRFGFPDLSSQELEVTSSQSGSLPIWGMMDHSLEIGDRSGCFSFGERSFSSEDDLKTYIHWMLRDVFFRLRDADESAPLGLRLADRTVTLEISAPGHLPVRLSTREAGTAGVRLPDSDTIYYFQPLILDEATKRVAVKVLVKDGPFFGEGTAQEIAFVVAEFGSPRMTLSDPILEIRCVEIQ